MTVELSPAPELLVGEKVAAMSSEELRDEIDGIMAATEKRDVQEHQLGFEEISKLFLDAHDGRVDDLKREKREMILDMLLHNPVEAFRGEFLQLELLFEERTLPTERYDGTTMHEFCTQDHQRHSCDYLFRHKVRPDGEESFSVRKVYNVFGKPDTISVTFANDELTVVQEERMAGRTVYAELEGDKRERVLAQLFYDTIHASALQFERTPDKLQENDNRAKGYLKKVRADEYALL